MGTVFSPGGEGKKKKKIKNRPLLCKTKTTVWDFLGGGGLISW